MGRDRPGRLGSQTGSILTERLIALALSAFIMVATLSLWQKNQETFFRGSDAVQAQQEARAALAIVVRDLRHIRSITAAAGDQITFTSIVDAAPPPSRTLDLWTGSGCILSCVRYDRGDGSGAQPIAGNIVAGGFRFVYRDASGTILATPLSASDILQVRQIDVMVRGQMGLSDPDPPFTLVSSVTLRNR